MLSESERIKFVTERDGEKAALDFVCQGLCIYTKAAMEDTKFKHSIATYVDYLKERGYKIDLVIKADNKMKEQDNGRDNLDTRRRREADKVSETTGEPGKDS